jgi:hypothetical protein
MTDNEFDRTARAWLEDGPIRVSDRVLQSTLDEIHRTRQRRPWWPARRFPSMGNATRLAAGAAAVVVATVVGINLFAPAIGGGVSGGVGPSTPNATPVATPEPTPTPRPLPVSDVGGRLEPGTYVTGAPFRVRATFTVPAGWRGNVGGPYGAWLVRADGRGGVGFSFFEKVYADPCHYRDPGLLDPLPGPTVDDLATALSSLPGLVATTPTDVTVSGYRGKQLTLTAPGSFDGCTLAPAGSFRIWELPLGATNDMAPGQVDRVWILDIDGERLVIDAQEVPGETAASRAEVSAIIDSIRIQAIAVSDRGRVPEAATATPGVSPTLAP